MTKLTNFFFTFIITGLLISCQQEQPESFVRMEVNEQSQYFINKAYEINISSSEDITSVTVSSDSFDEQVVYISNGEGTFDMLSSEVNPSVAIKLEGHDENDELIVTRSYSVSFKEEPKYTLDSPYENQSIPSGDQLLIKGSFGESISKVIIKQDGVTIDTVTSSPFSQYESIDEQIKSATFTFEFFDQSDKLLDTVTREISISTSSPVESLFNKTWEDKNSTIVIDAYQGNSIDWDKMAADKKMVAVIHRSSDGLRVDTKYKSRNKIANERGYLWGAYHLGRPGNVIEQAKLFLSLIKDDPDTLMVLDLEVANSSKFMGINDAVTFMNYIYKETGKIPVVYANHSVTKEINAKLASNVLFKRAPLWYARFRSSIPDFPYGVWDKYFLWQFSSEINCSKTGTCLYNVPGTTSYMDVNVYPGTEQDLRRNWVNPF